MTGHVSMCLVAEVQGLLQFLYSFLDRARVDQVLEVLLGLDTDAVQVAQLAKSRDTTR
jgi:hypothetical protein